MKWNWEAWLSGRNPNCSLMWEQRLTLKLFVMTKFLLTKHLQRLVELWASIKRPHRVTDLSSLSTIFSSPRVPSPWVQLIGHYVSHIFSSLLNLLLSRNISLSKSTLLIPLFLQSNSTCTATLIAPVTYWFQSSLQTLSTLPWNVRFPHHVVLKIEMGSLKQIAIW